MNAIYAAPPPLTATDPNSGTYPAVIPPPPSAPGSGASEIDRFLAHMVKLDASDLYLTVGSPPVFRANGVGLKGRNVLSAEQIDKMLEPLLDEAQCAELATNHELNFGLSRGEGRFRVNVFRQRGATGMVIRLIKTRIRTLEELGMPDVLKHVIMSKRGLVLVVGATGSGKSTVLAAMIDHRNASEAGHIVTIEDPIEFVHPHKQSVITQREVGVDTLTVAAALKNALRQAPDVILVGEIRDAETMEAALGFAETGHLCISTLHANNANQAVQRILNFFPTARHKDILLQLSLNLRSVIAQRLVPAAAGGRAPALEILLDTPRVKQLIGNGDVDALKDAMTQSMPEGCRTFDASLFELVASGRVTDDDALRAADSANELRLRIERLRATGGVMVTDGEPPLRLAPDPLAK